MYIRERIFAPEYERDGNNRVLFPRDNTLRRKLFPFTDAQTHIAKANMLMVKELVSFVSSPGDTILDPFAGTGSILVALTLPELPPRKIIMIEIESFFLQVIEQNIKGIAQIIPEAEQFITVVEGDAFIILPIPSICNHAIFSPPYADVWKKKGEMDKTTIHFGYHNAPHYSEHPDNIANLSPFLYEQKMERFYKKLFLSISPGGTLTVIIKDRMLNHKREFLSNNAEKSCLMAGFELLARNRWFAKGGAWAEVNKSRGLDTVEEEDLITFIRK